MAKMANNPVRIQFVRHNFSEIQYKNLRFLITDRPTDANMDQYVAELKKYNCKVVCRVCEPTYNTDKLLENNIAVLDWQFPDGHGPPQQVVDNWFNLLLDIFYRKGGPYSSLTNTSSLSANQQTAGATGESSTPDAATNTALSSSESGNGHPGGGVAYAQALHGDSRPVSGAASSRVPSSPKNNDDPCVAVHCVAGLGRAPVLVAIALMERGLKYEEAVDLIRQRRQGALNMKQLQYLHSYKRTKRLPRVGVSPSIGFNTGSGISNGNGVEHNKQCNIL